MPDDHTKTIKADLITDVPIPFAKALVKNSKRAYESAYKRCEGLGSRQLHDTIGHLRRAFMEQALLQSARLADGVKVRQEYVKGKSASYVRATAGRFTFTTLSARGPRPANVRHADYREQLARKRQPVLGPQFERGGGSRYYVHIIHGASDSNPAAIRFMRFAFPLPEGEYAGYYFDPVEVFDLDRREQAEAPQTQADGAMPRLKKNIQKKSGS